MDPGLNVALDRLYNKKLGPFYLKWYRRDQWFIWFRSRLFMSYYIPRNAHLSRHVDDVRPRFKFRLGKLSVDYE